MEPELEAMATVLAAVEHLPPEAQMRVLSWVLDKLSLSKVKALSPQVEQSIVDNDHPQLPAAAATWVKQNDLTSSDLESVFHLDGEEIVVIAASLPGKSVREKVLNCYILAGVLELLRSGGAVFNDKSARDLCAEYGCLDTTNHSKYLAERGNEFTGSKEKGWTITVPGKKRGAGLVKEIASPAA